MEINKEAPFNPIIQDTKKGKPRFYHSDSLVNYGAFPQTWEDPSHADVLVPEYKGDNGVYLAVSLFHLALCVYLLCHRHCSAAQIPRT